MFDSIIPAFEASPWLFYATVFFTGLCVGSFLNVVAFRLPVIMDREWKRECHQFLELDEPEFDDYTHALGLSLPASACPACGHTIRFWENIPVLSYLLLRGKCSACDSAISIQYPLIEILTAVASIIVAWHFGITLQTPAMLIFTWILIALVLIDIKKQLLPDNITLPLMWLGIFISLFNLFINLQGSIIGAIAGYLVLWSVFQLFKLVTGKEGMGYGDFKLLAALGAWGGYTLLPQIILISSVIGSIFGISMILLKLSRKQQPIPFGPYLAIAGWIALMWGDKINQQYLHFLQ